MEVKTFKIELRKHHVTPGVMVLDLVIETDEEKLIKQTQHKETDQAYKKFVKDAVEVCKELAFARLE